ncbi:hypothetical protein CVT26_001788 [Gymnopilus dilepis]|uniref:Polysaccharide lyase 14 domain-containing protein n=1 Tax=Gymnopilus dilepis TaxID=231916 RepID=A0A409VTB8_9AGAR|nr:hypothetical protein CVT26_001788 [Gymnopilus dilepis]
MTRGALLCVLLHASDVHRTWAAPIIDALQGRLLIAERSSPSLSPSSNASSLANLSYADLASLILGTPPAPTPTESQSSISPEDEPYPFSFSFTQLSTSTPSSTVTITVTEEEPTTIILSPLPITITELITITASPSSTTTSPSPSTLPDPGLGSAKALWTAPPDMKDLTPFNVSKVSSNGLHNMKIVTAIPSEAIATSDSSDPDSTRSSNEDLHSTGSMMQILYPENSINPGQKPQGGAEFYASPIDISTARNVTLQYRVFFPVDFDWVLAGKMPGLYGGHSGCSGGNAALDCFSTRLMWRKGGAGELYLYAPKDKQTDDLCSDPASVCDAAYGLSIGRGSFKWKPGAWTTVKQTVYLNTPGEQDGVFALDVDGERTIYREDVFYREDMRPWSSTFFGGHEEKYATPKDQYVWFKDFALAYNS